MATRDTDNDSLPTDETNSEPTADTEKTDKSSPDKLTTPATKSRTRHWWRWVASHKKVSIPAAVAVVLVILAAVPHTRYGLAGLVMKQSYSIAVVDSETGKPVSSAVILLDGKRTTTDGEGRASIRVAVGFAKLEISKTYYHSQTREVVVPFKKPGLPFKVTLKAAGRPVPVSVINKISKQAVAGITLKAEGTSAKTDSAGKATLVLPAGKKDIKLRLSGEGFNAAEATLTVTPEEIPTNTFEVVPSGKLYFLSNASGKLDLVKANLDGSERQTVLPGTGKEDKPNTVLLASRDWKYIALLSKRDGGEYAKLFLIEAGTDKVTVMDEGEATFSVLGWSGDRFIYKVNRQKVKSWEPKREALKSYHAPSKKITPLVETTAEGHPGDYAYQEIGSAYVLDEDVVYGLNRRAYNAGLPIGAQASLNTVRADGSQKRTIKSYLETTLTITTAEFGEIYIQYDDTAGKAQYEEYVDGKITASTQDEFYSEEYPFYSVSPSGGQTFWSEFRDGKNTFFVGDEKGENGKQIGASEDYNVYGWFSDDYVLVTKKGSEMHIMSVGGLKGGVDASLKVSDYYKPNYALRGYGYGYGG